MKARVIRAVVIQEMERLPTPKGRMTEDVRRAVELYVRLWGPDPVTKRSRARRRDSWELNGLLTILSSQELAQYYHAIRDVGR